MPNKPEAIRNLVFGRGEAALRIGRRMAKRRGDTDLAEQIDSILADGEAAAIAGVALEDESDGSLFRGVLSWIVNNPEEFKALIEYLVGLFTVAES